MTDPAIPSPADDPQPPGAATPTPPPAPAPPPPPPPPPPVAPAPAPPSADATAPAGSAPAASPWGPAPAPPPPAYPAAGTAYPAAAPVPTSGWTGAYDQPSQPGEQPLTMSDARMWAMLAHLSGFVLSIIAPLIIMFTLGRRSVFVKDQATEALNFQLTVLIASIVSALLIVFIIGIVMLIAVGIYATVFIIIAAVKSYGGELYRYPLTLRMVR